MKTAREQSQEAQYRIAKECLDLYVSVLEQADTNHVTEIRSQIHAIDEAIRLIEEAEKQYNKSSQRTRTLMGPALDAQLVVKKGLSEQKKTYERDLQAAQRESDGALEILLNQPNGTTDVLLPVKKETIETMISDVSLAHKLYTFVHDFCDDYAGTTLTEKIFEGYVVLSLDARLDKTIFARQLLDAALPEFGGARTGALVYVRVAPNFCFSYETFPEQTSAPRRRVVERRGIERRNQTPGLDPVQESGLRTITKKNAIEEFEQGKYARDINKEYPGTPTMTIAGWQSAWRKGLYK